MTDSVENNMKHWLLLILVELVACGAWGQTTNIPGGSETIGIYLVQHPSYPGRDTDKNLKIVELADHPILSDNDFVDWNVTNHTIVITPVAAIRLAQACHFRVIPFVVVAGGERIYLGMFETQLASVGYGVPVIITDNLVGHCFVGDVPTNIYKMSEKEIANVLNKSRTTNVTLPIQFGYPERSPDPGQDRRGDMKLKDAVKRLFAIRGL
jgi:hypothetical protein